jgi:hypothetical protein
VVPIRARVAGAVLAAMLAGCAASPDAGYALRMRSSQQCVRVAISPEADPPPPRSEARAAALAAAGYPERAGTIAAIIGVDRLLLRLDAIDPHVDAITALRVRQQAIERILLAVMDVQSVLAEIACEQARGEQLRAGLEGIAGRRAQRYALAGVLIGAVSAIASGGLAIARPESDAANVVGIVGGAAEGSAGVAGLAGGGGEPFETRRNMLGDVWEGRADTRLFPATVWRFLDEAESGAARELSVRAELIAVWRADERLDDPAAPDDAQRIALLFGAGGRYTSEMLQLREALLDLLQARVWLMSQDLDALLREVVKRE